MEITLEQVKIICGNTAQVEEWKKRKIARILHNLGETDALRGAAESERRAEDGGQGEETPG